MEEKPLALQINKQAKEEKLTSLIRISGVVDGLASNNLVLTG